jgi:hypothetical protein
MGAHVSPAVVLGEVVTSWPGPPFAPGVTHANTANHGRPGALSLSSALGSAACTQGMDTNLETPQSTAAPTIDDVSIAAEESALGESAHIQEDEAINEAQQGLGWELPSPGPGTILPGGHDLGGPGGGWGRGWAGDSQYAPYVGAHDPDPYKARRQAQQREYDRIREENHRHAGGRQNEAPREVNRRYSGGKQVAPDAPRPPVHTADGPLNDKARCEDECFEKYLDVAAY